MKLKSQNRFLPSALALALFASPAMRADTYYWDNTSPIENPGFGTAGGTWGSDAFWSASNAGTDSTGIAGPLLTDDLIFGTVSNVLGAGTVTVAGTQSANSLTFGLGSGAIALSGGAIDLAAAATINVDNTADTISSVLTGAGTSLTKSGVGTLTLSGINSYGGTTTISDGTLKLGNLAALGAGTSAADGTTIGAGATLDLGGILIPTANADAERVTVSGTGVGGNGAIISSSAIPTPFNGVRFLTLAGDTTLGFSNRWDMGHNTGAGPSSLVGAGFTLNILGTAAAAQASLNNLGATDLGDINVNLGSVVATNILYLQGTTDLGRPANTLTITGGSVVDLFSNNTNTTFDKKFALNNGILRVSKTGAISLPGTISLTTVTNTINANGGTVAITASEIISGGGSLIKDGAGSLTLSNANTYTGTTSINAGTLSINSILDVNGGASSIGAPTTPLDGTINMGAATGAGTLTYTGTGHTTNRVINLAGTSGGATFNHSGTGLLKFTSDFTATGNGGKTLTLQGSTAGTGEIAGAIVNNGTVSTKTTAAAFASAATTITLSDVTGITTGSRITGTGLAANTLITAINTGTGVVTIGPAATGAGTSGQTVTVTAITSLTKAGTGTWTLSGANTYTGITTLSAGVLVLGSTNALPGGIATAGGTGALSFSGGALGLGSGDFTRNYGGITAGTIARFDVVGNTGPWWVAYGADRSVNVNNTGATLTTFNGKPFNFGAADSTNMVTYVNGVNMTTATRQVNVYRGTTPGGIDARFSGNLTTSGANMAGWLVNGGGTIAFTGANTFSGRINIFSGIVVVNSLANTGSSSPIGLGTSGIGLAGGTFKYAPVAGSLGAGHSTNHNFTITASSSIDASGTGALVFNAPSGNIISPDLTTLGGTTTAASAVITGLTSTSDLAIGMRVTGVGIPSGRTIASIDSPTQVTLSSATSVTAGAVTAFGTPTARTLTLTGTSNNANTIAGVLQDSSATGAGVLSVAKTGVGSWTLSGASTYSGGTTVSNGSLTLGNATALGTAAVSVTGGSLDLGGQTIANAVSIGASGSLTGSGSTGAATLAGNMSPGGAGIGLIAMASATVASTSSISLQLAATGTRGTNYDAITVSGALALDGTITVTLNGLTPASGQSFDLIDATGPIDVTNFTVATDLVLPALSGGLTWDTSSFATTGVISITSGDPYAAWSGAADFDTDSNGDGVKNGLAWLLGATDKNVNATGLLPKVTQSGGGLVLTFTCLKISGRGTAVLKLQHSSDLGVSDAWVSVAVPDTGITDSGVVFTIPTINGDSNLVNLQATIPSSEAAAGKLFGRLNAETP